MPGFATASSALAAEPKKSGSFFGLHMPDIGVGNLIGGIAGSLSGIARMGVGFLPGGDPAGEAPAAFAKGLASSFAGTVFNAADIATADQATGLTGGLRDKTAGLLGGEQYRPRSLSQQYNDGGLLPTVVENVGNAAIVAGAASKLASLGELGAVAEAASAAGRASKLGFTAEDIGAASEAAKLGKTGFADAGITDPALKAAGKAASKSEGLGGGLDQAAIDSRTRMLDVLHGVSHPYKSLFTEAMSPLGRAATEKLTMDAQGAAEVPELPGDALAAQVAPADAVAARLAPEHVSADLVPAGAPAASNTFQQALADAVKPYLADPNAPVPDAAATVADALAPKLQAAASDGAADLQATPSSNTLKLTQGGTSPIADAVARAQSAAVPPWAKQAVAALPTPVVKLMSKADRTISARGALRIYKEHGRMQEVNVREMRNSDAMKVPARAASEHLVGRVLPDGTSITPELSEGLMGDEIIARLEQTSAVEDAVARHADPAVMEHLNKTMKEIGARSEHSIPADWLRDADGVRTPLGELVDTSVDSLRTALAEKTALAQKTSGKGLEHIADTTARLSPRSEKLMKSVGDDMKEIRKLEASKIPRDRVMAARKMQQIRDELHQVAVEQAGNDAEAKAASDIFDTTRVPKDASPEYLASGAPGITKALGYDEAAPEGLRTAQSPAQRAMSTPDVGGMSDHDLYRRGIVGGTAAERIKASALKARDLEERKVTLTKGLDEIKRTMVEHTLDSEVLRDKLSARSGRRLEAVAKQLEHPGNAQVPDHWKPAWDAIKKLHQEAETDPALASALVDLPETWGTVLKLAQEQGFDPTHIRSFQPSEVRKLVFDSVSLGHGGRDLGKTIASGTRKTRTAAQTRTRSLSAIGAAIAEATHEAHTNALAKNIEEIFAKPVVNDTLPAGYVGWDAERQFLLTGTKNSMGDTIVEGAGAPTKMIPREVKTVLDNQQKDYSHGSFRFISKAIDPWRLLVLTLSPRWYVNNFVGNVLLATKEGVSITDWGSAWSEFRQGGADLTRNKFIQTFGAGKDSFRDVSGSVAGGLRNELAPESLVPYSKGVAGLKQAKATDGTIGAIQLVQHRLNRANEVVDEMARVAVYKSQIRRGATAEHALNRVYASMIDYNDMSPFERQVVRSVVPFYAWQKAVLKITAKFPIDNPAVAGILLQLDHINKDLAADSFGGKVPDYYSSMIKVPGIGNVNTRAFNPFADSGSLTTPQGIAGSINPFLSIVMRNAYGAPDGASYQRTDAFGHQVTDTSPAQDFTDLGASLPQLRVGQALTGKTITGQEQETGPAVGSFLGTRTYSDDNVQAMIDRLLNPNAGRSSGKIGTPYEEAVKARLKANKAATK